MVRVRVEQDVNTGRLYPAGNLGARVRSDPIHRAVRHTVLLEKGSDGVDQKNKRMQTDVANKGKQSRRDASNAVLTMSEWVRF